MGWSTRRGADPRADDHVAVEARANTAAVISVVRALQDAKTSSRAAQAALDAVRQCFGWVYGS